MEAFNNETFNTSQLQQAIQPELQLQAILKIYAIIVQSSGVLYQFCCRKLRE